MHESPLSLVELKGLGFYTPQRAAEYLRRVRGLVYSTNSLRAIKRRKSKAVSAKTVLANNTLWTREELDAIEITSWTKIVPPEHEEGADLPPVLTNKSARLRCGNAHQDRLSYRIALVN